ncbi:Trp biosynthesis-associated membrane protein [Schumannella sp. 10F1B-5-1]|uniref:Trp biosynthesis-associated membrane protein n=1 Tax=Schumannella sp. 10F1B-5-1 TaxID=2590780 RepID=UPI00113053A8|nr:Trp biosynthesis-associated membrane protein [Schumannella sp. 10F1B-5-1]TPW71018.1 hypothetical protein FJ658_13075 [Schumannella sp. 10F1B-5-1]
MTDAAHPEPEPAKPGSAEPDPMEPGSAAEPAPSTPRSRRSPKGPLLLALIAGNALVLLAWSQQWFTLHLEGRSLPASGQDAAGPLLALALTGLVLVAALALAGVAFRVVLGVLQVLLGGCIALQAGLTLADPAKASAAVVRETAGLAGEHAADLVDSVDGSPWPAVALVLGLVLAVLGVAVAATATRWPGSSRRYTRTRFVGPDGRPVETTTATAAAASASAGAPDADGDAPEATVASGSDVDPAGEDRDAVADWDALSEGDDPTR